MKLMLLLTAVCVLQPVSGWLDLGLALPVTDKPQVSLPVLQCRPGDGGVAASFGGKGTAHSNNAMAPTEESCASLPDTFFFKPSTWVKEALSSAPFFQIIES